MSLLDSPAWLKLQELIQIEIEGFQLNRIAGVSSTDTAIEISSKLAYVNGLKRASQILESAKKKVSEAQ